MARKTTIDREAAKVIRTIEAANAKAKKEIAASKGGHKISTADAFRQKNPQQAGIPQGPLTLQPFSMPPSGEMDTQPLFGASNVQSIRLSMFNPLANFTPAKLSRWLNEQEAGFLNMPLRSWEAMARRDDMIVSVKGKKEDAVAQRPWGVAVTPAVKKDPSLLTDAEKQKDYLDYFWQNMTCVSAWDRNVRGAFPKFSRFVTHVQSLRYGGFHFNWQIKPQGLSAELEFVPGWLFENLTGELRFLGTNPATVYGTPLDPTNWLPIGGAGIMEAASICWGYKHLGLSTWIKYCARYGLPFPVGTINDAANSVAWNKMAKTLAGIHNDGYAVKTADTEIDLMVAAGATGELPAQQLCERIDRSLAAMFRGGDLGTKSSTAGQGTGASQQDTESLLIEAGDCEFVTEIMNQIERKVIDWYDGQDAPTLAQGFVKGPSLDDANMQLKITAFAVQNGARVSIRNWVDQMGIVTADEGDDDDVMKPAVPVNPPQQPNADDAEAVNRRLTLNFDPTEPRDDHGEWTAGAGEHAWAKGGEHSIVSRGDDARRGEMRPATPEERKLHAIPPQYKDAMVSVAHPSDGVDVIATAKTLRGKEWVKKTDAYEARQQEFKFERLKALHHDIPKLTEGIADRIASRGKDHDTAMALRLMTKSGMRNGSEDGAYRLPLQGVNKIKSSQFVLHKDGSAEFHKMDSKGNVTETHHFNDPAAAKAIEGMKGRDLAFPEGKDSEAFKHLDNVEIKTYGASSLRTSHARTDGDKTHFDFIGKGGHRQAHTVVDPVLAAHVRAKQAAGADKLFDTNETKTNGMLRNITGKDYKVHDIRAWHGTALAAHVGEQLKQSGELGSQKAYSPTKSYGSRMRIGKIVSRRLGNTPEMALGTYIHPKALEFAA